MAHNKILVFPVSKEYQALILDSGMKLKVLIQAMNMAHEKGYLNEHSFQGLLDYCGININRDLIQRDKDILQFHISNYYELNLKI